MYESKYTNPREPELNGAPVCVFVGRDDSGKERFAAIRGISVDLKRDVTGSDKRFGFTLPSVSPDSRALAVFEAPIDLLSHATLERRSGASFVGHRLSLAGTSDVSLMSYLDRNPEIQHISLCLDNDEAGRTAAQKIFNALSSQRFEHISVTIDLPKNCKDYNELLLNSARKDRENKQNILRREGVSSL